MNHGFAKTLKKSPPQPHRAYFAPDPIDSLETRRLLSAPLFNYSHANAFNWVAQFNNPNLSVQKINKALQERHLSTRVRSKDGGMFVLRNPKKVPFSKLNNVLKKVKGFVSLEPNSKIRIASVTPNDVRFPDQWSLENPGQNGGTADADIDASSAWDLSTGADDIIVAIIDSGVNMTHPDLAANIFSNTREIPNNNLDDDNNGFIDDIHGWDFANNDNDPSDDHGHGTHVAGTIAAVGNNSIGVAGIAWNVKILPLKFIAANGNGDVSGAVEAINYCVKLREEGFNIVLASNSWGNYGASYSIYQALSDAEQANLLFVAAAGNDGTNDDEKPFYPASFDLPNIISVTATSKTDAQIYNYGINSVDLGAPGESILSTLNNGAYGAMSGTSMATPHVSGVAALAFSISPRGVAYSVIRNAILTGGDSIPSLAGKTVTGKRLNAYGALLQLPLTVINSSPAPNAVVSTLLNDFTLTFSHPIDPSSLEPADLTVNSIAANSFTLSPDSKTAAFHFNTSPITSQGVQSLHIAASALSRLADGALIGQITQSFRYDQTLLSVVSSTPPNSAIVESPMTGIDLVFNEEIDPASLSVSDLVLGHGTVIAAALIAPNKVHFEISAASAQQNLTTSLPPGALTDIFGNPSLAWNAAFNVDVSSAAYPAPLALTGADGTGVYQGAVDGMINFPGDTDSFSITLKAGQILSILAQSDSTALLRFLDSANNLLSGATLPPGQPLAANSISIPADGLYTLQIAGNAVGNYSLRVATQALFTTADNHAQSSAASLDPGWIPLALGGKAVSVVSKTTLPQGVNPTELEPNDTIFTPTDQSLNFLPSPSGTYQTSILGEVSASDLDDDFNLGTLHAGDVITIAQDGSAGRRGSLLDPHLELWRDNNGNPLKLVDSDDDGPGPDALIYNWSISDTDVYYIVANSFTAGKYGTYALSVEWTTPYPVATGTTYALDAEPNNAFSSAVPLAGAWRPLNFTAHCAGSILTVSDVDIFSFQAHEGDLISAFVAGSWLLNPQVSILDPNGSVMSYDDGASTIGAPNAATWAYRAYMDGTYFVKIKAASGWGTYDLKISLATPLPPAQPTPNPDYYSLSLTSGDVLSSALQFPLSSNLTLELLSPNGSLLATASNGHISNFNIDTTGTYFLQVYGDRLTPYVLSSQLNASFDQEPNDTLATAQPLLPNNTVTGRLSPTDVDWLSFSALAGDDYRISCLLIPNSQSTLNPQIQLYDPNGNLLASNNDSLLYYQIPSAGTYYIHLSAIAGQGEYQLSVANLSHISGSSADDFYQIDASGNNALIFVNNQLVQTAPISALHKLSIFDPGGNDTLILNAPLNFLPTLTPGGDDSLSILSGQYTLQNTSTAWNGLHLNNASLKLANSSLKTNTLLLGQSASLHLSNSNIVIASANPTTIQQYVFNGQILTDNPAYSPAVLDNAKLHRLQWKGMTVSDGSTFSQTLITTALLGDANLDGAVTPSDLLPLYANLSHPGLWLNGDMNADGQINAADLQIILSHLT